MIPEHCIIWTDKYHYLPLVILNCPSKKLFKIINYLPYTAEKTHFNVKNMPLIYGVVRCVADRVWWAALCQKVQGHFWPQFCPWGAVRLFNREEKRSTTVSVCEIYFLCFSCHKQMGVSANAEFSRSLRCAANF